MQREGPTGGDVVTVFNALFTCNDPVWCQPSLCFGHMQTRPQNRLSSAEEQMKFSNSNTLYLYTSLLGGSTCTSGTLSSFSFCYEPACANGSLPRGPPQFYVLLLLSRGEAGYSVMYVHEELQEVVQCEEDSTDMTMAQCKEISVNSSMLIAINTSFSLAFIFPEDASGSYLYEAESTSLGIVSTPSPPIPRVGTSLTVQGTSRMIPNRLFQVVIEPEVTMPGSV